MTAELLLHREPGDSEFRYDEWVIYDGDKLIGRKRFKVEMVYMSDAYKELARQILSELCKELNISQTKPPITPHALLQ